MNPNNPSWIEPPPKRTGIGCLGKGCLTLGIVVAVAFLVLLVGGYFYLSRGVIAQRPAPLPVHELPPEALNDVHQKIDQFETAPAPPTPPPQSMAATPTPESTVAPPASTPERQLILTADEINGLIAANRKSRGHAYVSLSGNTATVQLSIPSDKVRGFPRGYLNGSFAITTTGPTPIANLQVSKIRANGYPVPSGVLSMSYRGKSIIGMALDAAAPYNVSTAEIQDGKVILR